MAKARSRGDAVTPAARSGRPPAAARVAADADRYRGAAGDRRAWWAAATLIAVLAVALYANSLTGALLFDDANAIVNNAWVRTGDVVGILTRASWWEAGRGHGWRPLTTLSFAANHAIHGLAPLGYHLVNVLLHAAVSVLVFAVFARAAAPVPAAVAAALFAAHPVHTEAVASVVGRAELMAAFGFFGAWLAFLVADERRGRGGRSAALLEAIGTVVFFAALLAKENAIMLLPVLAFADVLAAPAGARLARVRAHAPRYAAMALAIVVFGVLRQHVLAHSDGGATGAPGSVSVLDNPLVALRPVAYELTAIKVAGFYLWRLLVPWRLAADYSYRQIVPVESPLNVTFLAAATLVAVVAVGLWWTWRRAPAAALGLGVFAATFAIVSNLVFPIGTIMAERLAYLPSAGFCLVLAVLLDRASRRPVVAGRAARDAAEVVAARDVATRLLSGLASPRLAVPLALVLALYGLRTVTRNRVWHDRVTFFSAMVADAPESARSHRELGMVLADRGDFDGGHAQFERSLAIRPDDAATLYNLGNALLQEGRITDAIAAFQRALALKPDFADAMVNLGNAESLRGDHRAAIEWMRRALVLSPESASLHMNAANELFHLGDRDGARAEYRAALALAPDASSILTNYGAFLLAGGEYDAAAQAYRSAGDVPMALVGLVAIHRARGQAEEARALQARAARLFPNDAAVRQMGEILAHDAAGGGASGG